MTARSSLTARRRCGGVAFEAIGAAIVSSVCDCADRRQGSRQIEALPGAVRDADGGAAHVLFRRDRLRCVQGAARLKGYKLRTRSVTNRIVAVCCNAAMVVNFDRGPSRVSLYRARLQGEPLRMRIRTRSMPGGGAPAPGARPYPGYPPALMLRLAASGLAMWPRR